MSDDQRVSSRKSAKMLTVRDLHRMLDTESVPEDEVQLPSTAHMGRKAHWMRTIVGPPFCSAKSLSRNGASTDADGRRSGRHLKQAIMNWKLKHVNFGCIRHLQLPDRFQTATLLNHRRTEMQVEREGHKQRAGIQLTL